MFFCLLQNLCVKYCKCSWRRVGVIYSDDDYGREAFKQFYAYAPDFSQRIEFSFSLNSSVVNDILYIARIQQAAITPMQVWIKISFPMLHATRFQFYVHVPNICLFVFQTVGVSVAVLLCSNTLPYIQNFMQAAFISQYYGYDVTSGYPKVQYIVPKTFMNVMQDLVFPIQRPVHLVIFSQFFLFLG